MGVATGYTADYMDTIVAGLIVSGAVSNGELILTKNDGTTIDAGPVTGAKGATGNTGATGAQGPAGTVIPKATNSSGYPASPTTGTYVDDATLGLMRYNGTIWVQAMTAGTLLGDVSSTASVSITTQSVYVAYTGCAITITLLTQRRLRLYSMLQITPSASGSNKFYAKHYYSTGSSYNSGSSTPLGTASAKQIAQNNSDSSYAETTILLAAGTYTFVPAADCTSSANGGSIGTGYMAIYDAGAV